MFMAHGRRVDVYRRGGVAWFIWGCMIFMGLVGGVNTTLVDPQLGSKVFGVVIATICFGYAYVIWRAATVVLYAGGVLVGTPVRPRWIPWGQIIDVSVQPDISGYGQRGNVPVIQLKSGRSVKLGFFFVPSGRSPERDIAVRVANALKNHLGPAS
jgi:hypothetical protein